MKITKRSRTALVVEFIVIVVSGAVSYSNDPCSQGWNLDNYSNSGVYNCPEEAVLSIRKLLLWIFYAATLLLIITIIAGLLKQHKKNSSK